MAKILSSAVLFFLLWASALVVLGGVANIQKECEDTYEQGNSNISARTYCGTTYSLAWWIIALQAFSILFAMAAAFSTTIRANFAHSITHLFTAVTVLLMYISSTLYPMMKLQLADGTKLHTKVEVTLAGAIALMIVNFIYIILSAAAPAFAPTFTTAEADAHTPAATPNAGGDMKVTIRA